MCIRDRTTAVDNVNIDIKAGDFVAVLGHNGSDVYKRQLEVRRLRLMQELARDLRRQ